MTLAAPLKSLKKESEKSNSILFKEKDGILNDILEEKIHHSNPRENLTEESKWIFGANVIHLAAQFNSEALAIILNRKNSLKNSLTSETKSTALHLAAHYSNHYSTNQLIKAGAEVNCLDHLNQTPLHIAVIKDNISTSLLVKAKANVILTNHLGQTPLHIAVQNENIQSIIALLDAGKINVLTLDKFSQTAIHYAKTSKMTDMLLMFVKPEELRALPTADELFQHILKNHPKSMNSFLDLMISSSNDDLSAQEQELAFDLSLFGKGTSKQVNFLDHHLRLIEKKHAGQACLPWSFGGNCEFFGIIVNFFGKL